MRLCWMHVIYYKYDSTLIVIFVFIIVMKYYGTQWRWLLSSLNNFLFRDKYNVRPAPRSIERTMINCEMCGYIFKAKYQGLARTRVPTTRNCAPKVITFGLLAGVSLTEVQWKGLFLGEPPSWSRFTPAPGKYDYYM